MEARLFNKINYEKQHVDVKLGGVYHRIPFVWFMGSWVFRQHFNMNLQFGLQPEKTKISKVILLLIKYKDQFSNILEASMLYTRKQIEM